MSRIDVLDNNGFRTGVTASRQEVHRFGYLHRAVHLYLFDSHNNILLQRRSDSVDHYPGAYSISLTGHVDAGEHSCAALYREIQEELGLNAQQMNIQFLFSYRRDAHVTPTYIDHQFNDVYVGWYDFDITKLKFDTEGISELQLVPFTDFLKMVNSNDSQLALVYRTACADLLYFLKNYLNL